MKNASGECCQSCNELPRNISSIICLIVAVLFSPPAFGGNYYQHAIVAQTGQAGLTGMKGAPSINDSGQVAFIGLIAGGEGVFFANGQTAVNLSPNHSSSTFSTTLQINNFGNVVARDSGGGTFYVRLWNVASPGSPTVVDSTSGFRQSYCTGGFNAGQPCGSSANCPDLYQPGVFYPCVQPPQTHYISLLFPTINNNAETAYIGGITGTQTNAVVFAGKQSSHEYLLPSANRTMRALTLADNGRIVARAGNTSSSPIWLFEPNLASYVEIASPASGFSTLGELPGISDDGRIVAFAGNRGNGLGAFISFIGLAGGRITLPVAGENVDAGTPIFFKDFDLVTRVAIKSIAPQTTSLENAEVLICLVATPNSAGNNVQVGSQTLTFSAAKGIWTIRGHLKNTGGELAFVRDSVFPVIQVGDTVGTGGTLPVDSFSIYDPLSTVSASPTSLAANYVAFWASSGGSQVVVRSALNRVRVERTSKGRLLRTAAPYGGILYWGYVTTYDGKIYFDQDGQPRMHDCWQAQDVVPAGTYSGADAIMKYKDLDPKMYPGVYVGKPSVNLVDSPVRPLGHSSIYIHYGTGFEYFDSRPNINKMVYWTTGCIVFRESGELVSYPRGVNYTIEVADTFAPLSANHYMVSGTVKRPGGDNDLPLSGVVVKVMSGATEVNRMTTDAQGHYWISGLQPPGTFTVVPELTGYRFKGLRRSPPLPWLPKAFEQSPHVIQTFGLPPDCYGVDFLAVTANLTLLGRPQSQVQGDGTILVSYVIKNTGAADASAVAITSVTLGTTSTTGSLPDQVGTVAVGATFAHSMSFPAGSAPPGGWSRLQLKLTATTNGKKDSFQTSSRTKINN